MTTGAVEHFLGKLQRSMEPAQFEAGKRSAAYRITSVDEPYIGKKIGDCLVLERVGQGAMSIVYKGTIESNNETVAIKLMRLQLAYDPNNIKRFQREAKAVSRMSHPNLIRVHSVGALKSGQPFMVMDFIEGKSLGDALHSENALPWKRATRIFMQVCSAMEHAHSNNIIHRDLKPDNIMLLRGEDGRDLVKVVDFGIVKLADESQTKSQRLTATGEVWGSPVYMSPEQCTGKTVDARSDIYAAGLAFYESLTNKQVFDAKRITDIIMMQVGQAPKSFRIVRPDLKIPVWLETIVMKALEKDPINRFQSMQEFRRELEIGMMAKKDTVEAIPKFVQQQLQPAQAREEVLEDPDDEFIGRVLGDTYRIQSKLGEGGMSVVYRAQHRTLNRTVAIKIIREEISDNEAYRKRFHREAKALSSISHPNLVSIYEVGTAHTGQLYIVMEHLNGGALADLLDDKGHLTPKRAVPIFIQICDVMNYLHQQGVIHRDLKPHNIMLIDKGDQQDFVKIVDFGILKFDDDIHSASQRLTAAGDICGSPIYMSPEQIMDEKLDGRTDIYALGIALYETLLGKPPFVAKRIAELLNAHINAVPKPLAFVRPDLKLPPSIELIVMRALEKERDVRYQTMAEMKEDLQTLMSRLDQEMSMVVNGESLAGLPPLPVAGRISIPPAASRQQAANASSGTRGSAATSHANNPVLAHLDNPTTSSNRAPTLKLNPNVQPQKKAAGAGQSHVLLIIAVALGALVLGVGLTLGGMKYFSGARVNKTNADPPANSGTARNGTALKGTALKGTARNATVPDGTDPRSVDATDEASTSSDSTADSKGDSTASSTNNSDATNAVPANGSKPQSVQSELSQPPAPAWASKPRTSSKARSATASRRSGSREGLLDILNAQEKAEVRKHSPTDEYAMP